MKNGANSKLVTMLNRLHAPSNIRHFVASSSHLDLAKQYSDDKSINNIFMGESTVMVRVLKFVPRRRFVLAV